MKISLIFFIAALMSVSTIAQRSIFPRKPQKYYEPKSWGFRYDYDIKGTNGCVTGKKYLQADNGEFYLETYKRNILVESFKKKISITTDTKKVHFNLLNYYNDSFSFVTVFKGELTVHYNNWSYVVEAGQCLIISDSVMYKNLPELETKYYVAKSWTQKNYVFFNQPLFLIINRIARAHHYQVQYNNKPSQLVSGTITFITTIEDKLSQLNQY